ncbi:MAG: DUF1343 domain-containing protein [Chthoniobacterales bacterium]|nr:DUF1343 domain-containing protein [Chthoniobacterales bacterium]
MKASVLLPIDHLPELWPERLRGARVGAVLHPASVNAQLQHSSRVLEQSSELLQLSALFGPQHGYLGQTQDNMIEWRSYEHPRLGIPVHSLYGEDREPTPEMLSGLDVLLVDLQDIGARYYTFIWTMFLCMKAAAGANLEVVVLDRPNPINGVATEHDVFDPAYRSFVGLHPLPVRHGLTIGELAQKFQEEAFPTCRLTVMPMRGWERAMWFDQTGLPWVLPSPNMPTLDTATVYPGMCLLEGTNISEGRGTTRPFEIFGASFIDAEALCRTLNSSGLPGVFFREHYFQPTFHKFAGELCGGAQIHVTDRETFRPFATAVTIIQHLRATYPNHFQWKSPPYEYEYHRLPIEVLIGGPVGSLFPD